MITEDDVRHVAKLARLRLEAQEVPRMTGELGKILDHVAKIGELDLGGVPPMAHVLDLTDVYRDDEPRPSLDRADALRNAPAVTDDSFRVPRMGQT